MAFSQSNALDHLRRANEKGRLAHAYLISGPDGLGIREVVSGLAAFVNQVPLAEALTHPDVHLAEPESKSRRITVDQVRALERELQMRSLTHGRKIAVIFEADRLMPAASNAFLKTLEEPPANSLLILTTAHPAMLLDTIISRCVPVPLMSDSRPGLSAAQRELVGHLENFFRQGEAGVGEVYQLIRHFQDLLQETKEAIQKRQAEEWKQEEAHYKQTTDGKWLAEREGFYKALTESLYIRERFELVDVLMQWWADILRHQQDFDRLDLPEYREATARLAEAFSPTDLLHRIAAIEQFRELFGTNVQETLVIETSLLKAFAD